jgi:hypothetical protein
MGGDHLPAQIREAHPRLALAADQVAVAHLELEVHGGEVAPEREDLEAQALLLDAGARRARDAMGVDRGEPVAVLVQCVADRVRAVPEGGVEDVDLLSIRACS